MSKREATTADAANQPRLPMKLPRLFVSAVLLMIHLPALVNADFSTKKAKVPFRLKIPNEIETDAEGEMLMAYDSSSSCIGTVFFLAVGTAMGVGSYRIQAKEIIKNDPSIAVVMIDNRPGILTPIKHDDDAKKWDARCRFAGLVNTIHQNMMMDPDFKICSKTQAVVGGHSTGGLLALEAIHFGLLDFQPTAYFGLDPEMRRKNPRTNPPPWNNFDTLKIPVMIWGFNGDTCQVRPESGSKLVYSKSSSSCRVLYQAPRPLLGLTGHCDFSDRGCPAIVPSVCLLSGENKAIKSMVGESAHKLVGVILNKWCAQSSFDLTEKPIAIRICANRDSCKDQRSLATPTSGEL